MSLHLFDTRTAQLQPVTQDPVRLYVCGVTPYDTTHLGHAFTFIQFDALVRTLRFLGAGVQYVQNITDIDDSILQRAQRLGVGWRELGDAQAAQYVEDMEALRISPPTRLVRATESIPTILRMIAALLERQVAYVSGGSVFFRVHAAPHYGELSRLDEAGMLAIAAQQDDADLDDPRKEDPLDFALWKGWSGEASEPCWESPWGLGRPGWHIECSAMCLEYLGEQVTIHGGGADLVYPHHESEIVQSEAATGVRPFVLTWMHVAMVEMDGAKMSKSLGNMVFVRDLVPRFGADALRYYLLSHHYREPFAWSETELRDAQAHVMALGRAARGADLEGGAGERFRAALKDDLGVPGALAALDRASGMPLRELAGALGFDLAD